MFGYSSKNMIEMAKRKLADYGNTKYVIGDFLQIDSMDQEFDVVLSSLALHHLETDADKISFYRTIYHKLKPGGAFLNADVVLGSNERFQNTYISRWVDYMNRSVSLNEIYTKWIPTYKSEDRPARLIDQLKWPEGMGFQSIDVIWKYYNFSVYGGIK